MLNNTTMAERVAQIRNRIDQACARAGRYPREVTLLPVSKTFDVAAIREAIALGFTRFGENRTQEIAQKAPLLGDCDVQWVVIGQLQTNKAKEVAKFAHELQSLDRLELAEALDRRLQQEGRAIDVLVQVKTSPEETKSGLEPSELFTFLRQLANYQTLRVQGLMTMAVLSEDTQAVRACFAQLKQLQARAREEAIAGVSLERLSMGMSGDFEIAIEEGSTEVRVGSAIFGSRS
ncbi:YggS family pyridoxal phosphate-dependent enzyme [Alcaligenaceae bacterium LF4-65]|uniref:Pyridoxal phosphate homeostasis protein n=1 Tax=Zwartia hollandica TaxID=324606 RepID=A0A953NAQ5_9BURK|nr:YggS family pyridoxal phosphate-dependent enzyme [Zwartia hollandica]MBZ1349830.1 YggS family pyridoxal phosphate-dependent enzyme [Zwartia hollandica]